MAIRNSSPKERPPESPANVRGVHDGEWRHLVDSARLYERLAPWGWMNPGDFFGIRLAPDAPVAGISIMGARLPNHTCFAFMGWEATARIRDLMQARTLTIHDLIEVPAMQLAFVKASEMGAADRDILRAAGARPDAGALGPVFRCHRPGYLPWHLEGEEVRQMAELLRQTAGVAMRRESEPDLLKPPEPGLIWVRSRDATGAWQEEWLPCPPSGDFAPPPALDAGKLARVAALPCRPSRVEFDLALSRATVGEPGHRLRTTYLLAALDSEKGLCIGGDIILPEDGLASMWRSVPDRLLDLCFHAGGRPREIEVASEQMLATLRPLLGQLPIKLTLRGKLPHFQTLLEGMGKVNPR